jgi:hypothetical protein
MFARMKWDHTIIYDIKMIIYVNGNENTRVG